VEAFNGARRRSHTAGCESFDADKVGPEILLRHWHVGDRFQPIGMSSPVKLQDWFTNQKIPRERRRELVMATTATGEIFWVEGLRISEKFKLDPQTKRRLVWRWSV
jgi:tRNA(Ile)-lysidine synthase